MAPTRPRRRGRSTSWLHAALAVRGSKIHGRGVFATEAIPRGERVAIFGGDVMTIDEIDELPTRLQEFPMQIEERFVLGSRHGPEAADYFNHSCDANAGFKGQIFLVAMRGIRRGEEVTFDYAMVVSPSVESGVVFEMDCRCGSPRCRKRITEEDWRKPDVQAQYRGFFSQYIEEKSRFAAVKRSRRRG